MPDKLLWPALMLCALVLTTLWFVPTADRAAADSHQNTVEYWVDQSALPRAFSITRKFVRRHFVEQQDGWYLVSGNNTPVKLDDRLQATLLMLLRSRIERRLQAPDTALLALFDQAPTTVTFVFAQADERTYLLGPVTPDELNHYVLEQATGEVFLVAAYQIRNIIQLASLTH